MKSQFAMELSRLLNALPAGSVGSSPFEVALATMLLASQAHPVSESNGLS
ncbi:MAG TPA: hypothetical protein VFN23_14315 [Ktedonobacteraceae bacterium]|nr:hypothetical protein [Ktedonobacteraceae bacterium]